MKITDVLKPIDEEEFKKAFKKIARISWEKYNHYLNILEENGIEVLNKFSTRINKAEIRTYRIIAGINAITTTWRKEDAKKIIQKLRHYAQPEKYTIIEDYTFLEPIEVRKLAYNLKFKTGYLEDFSTEDVVDLHDKYTREDYMDWAYSPEGPGRELIKQQRQRDEEFIDESIVKFIR